MESAWRFVQFICISSFCSSLSNAEDARGGPPLSPLSQFFPPNPSGQSQLKDPHRLTQVPPFRHGLVLQKCLLAEQPATDVVHNAKNSPEIINLRQSLGAAVQTRTMDLERKAGESRPGRVPLLAMKLAMSTCWLSTRRFFMQPTNCRLRTGKSSGSFGTPPRSRGPVRSRDLRRHLHQRGLHHECGGGEGWGGGRGAHEKFITEAVLHLFSPRIDRKKWINAYISEKSLQL